MRRIWPGVLAFGLLALPTLAQEKEKEAEPEQTTRDERPHVQVLKHPYDISSFYRSPGGNARGFSYGYRSRSFADLYSARDYDNDNESGVPLQAYRPDLRGRFFGPRWDSDFDFSDTNWRLDDRSHRRRSERRRGEGREARPAR